MSGELEGVSVQLLVDTGATVNLISWRWWSAHGQPGRLQTPRAEMYAVDGRPMDLKGEGTLRLKLGERTILTMFVVTEMGNEAILGAQFLRESGVIIDVLGERLLWPEETDVAAGECRVVSARPLVVAGGAEALVEG